MSQPDKILIVDDDPDFVAATRLVLETEGYAVDSASGGAEALARIEHDPPDLMLLDVIMASPLEGVRVSQQMMTRRGLKDIPIIMITSILSTNHAEEFPQDQFLHINAWLNKPCPPAQLLAEVRSALARSRQGKPR
jgi:CheY-like chemotaxis protein